MEFVTDFQFSQNSDISHINHHTPPPKLPANLIYFFMKESPLLCETPWGRGYGQNHWQTAETGFRQNAVIHSK